MVMLIVITWLSGDRMLGVSGHPYDTLEEVIGQRPGSQTGSLVGSLKDWGIEYSELELAKVGTFKVVLRVVMWVVFRVVFKVVFKVVLRVVLRVVLKVVLSVLNGVVKGGVIGSVEIVF